MWIDYPKLKREWPEMNKQDHVQSSHRDGEITASWENLIIHGELGRALKSFSIGKIICSTLNMALVLPDKS
jgi:hypothetical protein